MDKDSLKIRHQKSAEEYPELSLQDGEHVELEFVRAAITNVLIWIVAGFSAALLTVVLVIFNTNSGATLFTSGDSAKIFINLIGIVFYAIIFLGGVIVSRVFRANRLYVTNRRAIQHECISLFGQSVNIIDLTKIEDVSFKQAGFFQYLFGIGTIRMSTVGDETTYTFKYAYKPTKKEMKILTELVSNAKPQPKN